jgi:hypothetical protein
MAKKGYTTGASLQPTLLFRATPSSRIVKLFYIRLNYTTGENITETISPDIQKKSEKKEKKKNNPKYTKHPSFVPECYGSEEILRILGPIAEGCGVERRSRTRDHRTLEAITFAPTLNVQFRGGIEILYDFFLFFFSFFPPSHPNPLYVN